MFDAIFPKHWTTLQRLMWLKTNALARAVYETITGNPVSFTAKAAPLRQLQVAFSPVQDLNGYDSPWPAGGGKNLFDALTWVTLGTNSNFYSVSADETITVIQSDGSGIMNRTFAVDAGEQYSYLSSFSLNIRVFDSSANTISSATSGTFIAPDDGKIAVKFYVQTYPTSGRFILVKGSTIPTDWTPYSNLCPISGWSSLAVEQRGGNLWDEEWEYGNIRDDDGTPDGSNVNYWRSKNYIPVKSGATYYHNTGGYTGNFRHFFYSADKTWISTATPTASASGDVTGLSFTVPAGAAFMKFRYYTSHDSNPNNSINYPSTDTDYVPYNPSSRSISISLGETVYSGYVDVVTGVGEITGKRIEITSADTIHSAGINSSGYLRVRYYSKGEEFVNHGDGLYNQGTITTAANAFNYSPPNRAFVETNSVYIMPPDTVKTQEEYIAWLGDDRVLQVFFSLATPIPIQLTPQEVSSLLGENNMWSDANGDLTVEYRSN